MGNTLTTDQQISIIKQIDINACYYLGLGLCFNISLILAKEYNIGGGYCKDIKTYIPLFTLNNALQFDASNMAGGLWWGIEYKDYINRENFCNWLISELTK